MELYRTASQKMFEDKGSAAQRGRGGRLVGGKVRRERWRDFDRDDRDWIFWGVFKFFCVSLRGFLKEGEETKSTKGRT